MPAAIILAAGKGTRMKSDLPKGLHPVCGLPIVEHVVRAARGAGVERPIVVVGHGGDLVRAALGEGCDYAEQRDQLGTGHAAMMARPFLQQQSGAVFVLPGDTPLLSGRALQEIAKTHAESGAQCTVATCLLPDATGYGRIVRDGEGNVAAIVEHKDATPEQRQIREINSAMYLFDAAVLASLLPKLRNDNAQGEYYLTDVVALIRNSGGWVAAHVLDDPTELTGVNDRWQLSEAAGLMRRRLLQKLAVDGVTVVDPSNTYVDTDVRVGRDSVLEPGTVLLGRTSVGEGCRIGPFSRIQDSVVGDRCTVVQSHLREATMEEGSRCGPFAHLRPGTVVGKGSKIGNFVELKNATLGEGVSAGHLTYLGDAEIGAGTNIGAGTITCNYDGFHKHRTVIGEGSFIGSNSTLVAPVTIGDGGFVAAGSVVTVTVPDGSMAIGRSRTEVKIGWAAQWRAQKRGS